MKVLISLVVALGIAYYIRSTFNNVITSATAPSASTCVELQGSTTSEENGIAYIVGSVKNNCDRKFINVIVSFKIDRPQGDNLPSPIVTASVRNLQPGDTMPFKSVVPIYKNAGYRFDAITAF